MFQFKSLSVLFKESNLLESIVTRDKKARIQVIVNGVDTFVSQQSQIHDKLVVWKSNAFEKIHTRSYGNTVMLEFVIIKNKEEIGRARSVLKYGQNKKDCLDLADSKFHIVGKFLYEVVWYGDNQNQGHYYKPNNYQNNQYPSLMDSNNAGVNPYYRASSIGRQTNLYAPNLYAKQIAKKQSPPKEKKNKSQQKKKRSNSGGLFSSMFCCISAHQQRPKMKKIDFAVEPIIMTEQQLPYAPHDITIQPLEVQYYSKRFGERYVQQQ